MKILIVDNNILPDPIGSPELQRVVRQIPGAELTIRRAVDSALPANPRDFDRIVISGARFSIVDDSPWLNQMLTFIRKAVDESVPFLGVCHGHQALAKALGGNTSVRHAAVPEFGWTPIHQTSPTPLFNGLQNSFHTFSCHFDEIVMDKMPQGMKRIARSADCEVQACQLEGKPAFGIQFHPEKDLKDTEACFDERRAIGSPKLHHEHESEKYYDPKVGQTIFLNFLKLGE